MKNVSKYQEAKKVLCPCLYLGSHSEAERNPDMLDEWGEWEEDIRPSCTAQPGYTGHRLRAPSV